MAPSSPTPQQSQRRIFPPRRRSALTLLELITVVIVLGLIALIAVPTYKTVQERSELATQLARDEAVARNTQALLAFADGTTAAQALDIAVSELPPAPGVTASNGYTTTTGASTRSSAIRFKYAIG